MSKNKTLKEEIKEALDKWGYGAWESNDELFADILSGIWNNIKDSKKDSLGNYCKKELKQRIFEEKVE